MALDMRWDAIALCLGSMVFGCQNRGSTTQCGAVVPSVQYSTTPSRRVPEKHTSTRDVFASSKRATLLGLVAIGDRERRNMQECSVDRASMGKVIKFSAPLLGSRYAHKKVTCR
ncbi:uncharacterized protein UTRI_01086 [Ustilago trichophora]|uniref:Secreted protein n=1 Tax=Ustilago trichophora TaxID=86804 RepID=A0A5C3DW20_9BASI|nr:uncharacterized protein UTRI_01086 [Ustilago trichophora]